MATYVKFYSFVEALAEKVHNLSSDTLTVALIPAANPPSQSNTVLANLTQATYTYCSSRVLTVSDSSQTTGTYKLTIADKTISASGGSVGPFRYVVIYNDTASNDELICYHDYGTDITLADGEELDLDFSDANGLLQLS
jgi:hypothetical protein